VISAGHTGVVGGTTVWGESGEYIKKRDNILLWKLPPDRTKVSIRFIKGE
jgi:hypothetical protein